MTSNIIQECSYGFALVVFVLFKKYVNQCFQHPSLLGSVCQCKMCLRNVLASSNCRVHSSPFKSAPRSSARRRRSSSRRQQQLAVAASSRQRHKLESACRVEAPSAIFVCRARCCAERLHMFTWFRICWLLCRSSAHVHMISLVFQFSHFVLHMYLFTIMCFHLSRDYIFTFFTCFNVHNHVIPSIFQLPQFMFHLASLAM